MEHFGTGAFQCTIMDLYLFIILCIQNKKKVKGKNENGMGDWALSDYPAQNTFFFLEYAGELHTFVLREEKTGTLQRSPPHSESTHEG